jgi:glycosyltransferase involved in cell wall biosynthesis
MALTDPVTLSPVSASDPPARGGALALSAAVICLNEAACIGKCLESLGDCAEIIVVDSGSTDATPSIVDDFVRRGFPVRFILQPWLGYARQKQFALDQTKEPWIVSVDADEWLDEDLRASLPRLMAANELVSGWKVRRSLTLYGQTKPVSRWTRPEHILRLVRRGRARFDPALIVHEGLVADHGETPVARDGVLRHERSLPLFEQMKKEITYARLKAELFPANLLLEPVFSIRPGGLHPRGDRRHVFSHDRIDPSAIVYRANGALTRVPSRRCDRARRDEPGI